MKASELRVPPEMELDELIPFLQGIQYAEKFYGIGETSEEVRFEEMEAEQ